MIYDLRRKITLLSLHTSGGFNGLLMFCLLANFEAASNLPFFFSATFSISNQY